MIGRRTLYEVGLLVGVLCLIAGAWGLLQPRPEPPRLDVNAAAPAQIISPGPFNHPIPTPSQIAPPKNTVPHEGLRIKMPELGIDLEIVPGDGWNAPLYRVAHYPGLPYPGEGGRSVIYGHARTGMFGPLFQAKVGQRIFITRSDGTLIQSYTIREYYPSWPATDTRWLQPTDYEELVLVTCTTYNTNDPRVIVVARPD
jgi:LPXTG-site transpeptidase (sortase) family protein